MKIQFGDTNMVDDFMFRTSIGTGGLFATIGLESINEIVSIAVGCATFVYMVCSIVKLIKNWKSK